MLSCSHELGGGSNVLSQSAAATPEDYEPEQEKKTKKATDDTARNWSCFALA